MWISKRKYEQLVERIDKAEKSISVNRARAAREPVFTTVYSSTQKEWVMESIGDYEKPKAQQVTVNEALQMVFDKLGLKIEYVDGKPDSKALVKK